MHATIYSCHVRSYICIQQLYMAVPLQPCTLLSLIANTMKIIHLYGIDKIFYLVEFHSNGMWISLFSIGVGAPRGRVSCSVSVHPEGEDLALCRCTHRDGILALCRCTQRDGILALCRCTQREDILVLYRCTLREGISLGVGAPRMRVFSLGVGAP